MPEQNFALEQDGSKRLRVVSKMFSSHYTFYLDGQLLGQIEDAKDLKKGRDFTLPDGTKLNVRQKSTFGSTELQLFRNGTPLPESNADPQKRLQISYGFIYAIGVINIVGGIVLLLTQTSSVGGLELKFVSAIATGIIYLVLGFFVQRRSKIALGVAVIGFVFDTLSMVLSGVAGPGVLVTRFVFFVMPIIKGFGAIHDLNNPPPVQNRDISQGPEKPSQFKSFPDEIADDPIPAKPHATLSTSKNAVPAKKAVLESFSRLELALSGVVALLIMLVIGVVIVTAVSNQNTPVIIGALPTPMILPTLPPVWTPTTKSTTILPPTWTPTTESTVTLPPVWTPTTESTATLPPLISTPTSASDFAPTAIIEEQTPVSPLPETSQNSTYSITIANDLQKIVFDTNSTMAYGLDYTNEKVWFIDLAQKTVSDSLDLSGAPVDACIHPSKRRLYVVNKLAGTITEIDMDTKLMIRELIWPGPDDWYLEDPAFAAETHPFHIACQTDRLLLVDSTRAPQPWMISLTPGSFAQAFETSEFHQGSAIHETGIGDWAFTSDPNEFYYWLQIGWNVGYAGSEIFHARFDGNEMINLDRTDFTYGNRDQFQRDPLDTPIFLDVVSKRLIAKRAVFDNGNLERAVFIFPLGEEIYAVDWNRNLAASKKAIYDLNTFRTILVFDGVTPDQVYFAPDGRLYLLSNSTDMLYSLTLAP